MSGFLNETGTDPNRNMFLAFALALGLILVWQAFMTPPAPPDAPAEGSAVEAAPAAPAAAPTEAPAPAAPAVEVLPPQVLRGANHTLEVTNVGARVARVTIDEPTRYQPHEETAGVFPAGGQVALPVSVEIQGIPDLTPATAYALAETEPGGRDGALRSAAYTWQTSDGQIQVRRRYVVDEETPFSTDVVIEVANRGATERRFDGLDVGIAGAFDADESGGMFSPGASVLEGLCAGTFGTEREPARGVDETRSWGADDDTVDFIGVGERYFLTALAPTGETALTRCELRDLPGDEIGVVGRTGSFVVPAGGAKTFTFALFTGPKHRDFLDPIPGDLKRSIDLGWFSFIAVPLRAVLLFFQGLVVNWGLAIVLLTVAVKIVLFPVTQSSYVSMEKMKLVQPQLQEIQKKFENDRAKLAEEQMALFRREGVSPLGGCLPMLAQMPIYIALYRTIWGSTELYNAPLALWIHDMSRPDPYFVLPLVLGVVMFGQNRLMPPPAGGGDMQQQMAQVQKFMPLLFTMMMLFLPSGLVLYILVNMLLSIAQMLHIRKKFAKAAEAKS